MSKDFGSENSNIKMNNNNELSSNSFNDSKLKMNMNINKKSIKQTTKKSSQEDIENKSSAKDLSYIDKFKFIKDCIQKVQNREMREDTELSDLKQYEKTFLSKIQELKDDIIDLTKKVNEARIAKTEVDKQIKLKEYFLKKKLSKYADEDSQINEENEDLGALNEKLEDDIEKIKNEMKEIGDEIQIMSEQSLDTHQDIENLKKNCDELIRNNHNLKKIIQKKEKQLARMTLENKKINNKIEQQEINSEKFLKEIEEWANKESNIKYNNLLDVHDVH